MNHGHLAGGAHLGFLEPTTLATTGPLAMPMRMEMQPSSGRSSSMSVDAAACRRRSAPAAAAIGGGRTGGLLVDTPLSCRPTGQQGSRA